MGSCTNEIKLRHIKSYWFLRRGENRSTRRKTSRSRVENQQTQPTYDAGSGNGNTATLVGGESSHHCPIPPRNANNEKPNYVGLSTVCRCSVVVQKQDCRSGGSDFECRYKLVNSTVFVLLLCCDVETG